jgi:cell division protein FtsB
MATTRQPRQFLAVWNDAGTAVKGATFEESLFVDGAFWKNELTAVAPEDFADFGTLFSNQLQIQHDALVTQVASLTAQVTELTTNVASLTSEKAVLTSEKATLTSEKATLTASLTAANARIATLLEEVPFDPRIIDATAFYNRLTKDELLVFVSSSDPQLVAIGKVIADYKSNDWPVIFASVEFQQMVGYLRQVGVLTEARLAELTKDATRAEAYSVE